MRKFVLSIILVWFTLFQLAAQSLYKVELDEKVNNATLIVEGKVIEQNSFWNPQHTMIYTANKVEIAKIFKGSTTQNTIDVLTVGGSVGGDNIEASDLLTLAKDEIGVIFCFPNSINLRSPGTNKILFDVYASSQGFLSYDLNTQKASAPFAEYDVVTGLYPELKKKTGRSYTDLKPSFKVENYRSQYRTNAVSITSVSHDTVNAGALLTPSKNLITITGSGFGTASGLAAILFDDANNGTGGTDFTVAYSDPLVVSWSDTEIQVRVPSRAGTGFIKVRDAVGNIGFGPNQLNVLYSILNTTFFGNTVVKESNLMNNNGLGGYTIVYSTGIGGSGIDFDAHPAKATFQRALNTWKEINGLNVIEGGTTFAQAISGPENIIMFDNANTGAAPLPSGVLAVCYSFNTICPDNPTVNQAQKTGFDIVVRNSGYSLGSTTFAIGPCPPNASNAAQTDLETVLLHELGHALNLGHINDNYEGFSDGQINPPKLMNFTVRNGVKRVSPDFSAFEGANYAIQPQGNIYETCTGITTEMIPLVKIIESKDECPSIFPATITPRGTIVNFDLVHATSNKFVDPVYTNIRCDFAGAAQTNNAWHALRTNSVGSGTLNLSVSGYTLAQPELAFCSQIYVDIPVTGVRLSVYQVNSCPAPLAFPLPVACNIITGNGSLAPISVSPNSTYLLYLEGVENTKATFNLTLGGLVLPVKLKEFTGKALQEYNLLSWMAEAISGIESMNLQKSRDGIHFTDVASFQSLRDMEKSSYKDFEPFAKTYYRLAFKNTNQTMEYSSVVLLQREVKNVITVYPNPAKDVINIQLNHTNAVNYTYKLYNNTGQLVYTTIGKPGIQQIQIPLSGIAKGVYQLLVLGENANAETHRIIVQ